MSLFRPNVDAILGYVPGEQPQEPGWVKLNTNENPYPPSPKVIEALERVIHDRLNLYPDPLGSKFRQAVAKLFQLDPEWVLPANGSDENLTILMRSFINSSDLVVYPYPSYILYETLVDLQAGRHQRLHLQPDWSWDLRAAQAITAKAKMTILPNPNSPTGNRWSDADIVSLIPPDGLLVLDEAYGDFADQPHQGELLRGEQGSKIVVTRTLSKSYSLAGLRVGFALAHPDLIRGMRKMKDSYNCDKLSLAGATAAIEDQNWMKSNTAQIRATRRRMTAGLLELGFQVVPSQANFVWATHPSIPHRQIYEQLKAQKILVRFMVFPDYPNSPSNEITGLRITVGTDPEIDQLLHSLKGIV
ncbi:MAG: hisC [Planctomycetaceae bacterium]|nr:hisC [Planctomycetaceae bacterium]